MRTLDQKSQIARINRILKPEYMKVVTTRGDRNYLGDFHLMDTYRNAVVECHLDLDQMEADQAEAKRNALIEMGVKIKYQEFIDKYSHHQKAPATS